MNETSAAMERVRALHRRRPHSANGGAPTWGGFDFVAHGQTDFPDLCNHCRRPWPCETAIAGGFATVGCDHPGFHHGLASVVGICPKCHYCKVIGHGPLCADCYGAAPPLAE